ncbi:MAG: hypothetical protein R2695_15475 [Acidimicrobiales bacterium]
MLVGGRADGEIVGVCAVLHREDRPLLPVHVELVVGGGGSWASSAAGWPRSSARPPRHGRAARSEVAALFLNTALGEVEMAVLQALARIGEVFGARRVRWVEIDQDTGAGTLVTEWHTGERPDAPTSWTVSGSTAQRLVGAREPFVVSVDEVRDATGLATASPSLVVPAVIGNGVQAALSLTGDSVDGGIPTSEHQVLTDLAGLVHQARLRASQQNEAAYRQRLDEMQLRLAARFLDRTVDESGPVVDWALGEIGEVMGVDMIAFAEYGTEATMHWWTASRSAQRVASAMDVQGDAFRAHFRAILDGGRPHVTRSRQLPDGVRDGAEQLAGASSLC